jgi:hypothetical protein
VQISNEHLIRDWGAKSGGADVALVTILAKFHPNASESIVNGLGHAIFARKLRF